MVRMKEKDTSFVYRASSLDRVARRHPPCGSGTDAERSRDGSQSFSQPGWLEVVKLCIPAASMEMD